MVGKALIFGVSGQDGAYLARHLLDKGYEVHGTSRDADLATFSKLKSLGIHERVTTQSATTTDFRSVFQAITRVGPTEIYNFAGQSSVGLSFGQPAETMESNVMGTLNILEAMRMLGGDIRFYNACSSECFGNTEEGAADEQTLFRPRSPYAVAKAAAFWEVANYREAYGLFACSGILFNHESPLRPTRFVTSKIINAVHRIAQGSSEKLALGKLGIRRDWGWAPEYVDAMARMLRLDAPEDFVIATGEDNSLEDFVAQAFAEIGKDWREFVVIDPTLFRPSDLDVSRGNPAKAQRKLGWCASTHMQGVVRKMLQTSKSNLT
ncbi:MAG: GDP-mannose 4,6-dehydratase [Alphaproteobacteria bacterium]|nr:GDP-mannose 4,6-dehydratase [Alphaproteobacteria bacterium]